MTKNIFSILVFLGIATSCYYDNAEEMYADNNQNCDVAAVTFSQDVSKIIAQNCSVCHSGSVPSAGLSLTTYAQIKVVVDNGKLQNRINRSQGDPLVMPQGNGPMQKCNIDKVNAWIAQGALEN